ncbi:hypothetical protein QFC21_005702 [Naganishia friedmannii]|uniref:Uncharacterized protein n=1 Tax=Naganishia friedmannii TaxID=89922 RepID=A0ACC2V9N3_9TREE|nr:hypothetical protein QFC21_005702 [Naganishia friedmannii]
MSILLASAARVARRSPANAAQQVRGIHFENVVGKTMPFSTKSKPATALKVIAFACTGFGLPFLAAAHHIDKVEVVEWTEARRMSEGEAGKGKEIPGKAKKKDDARSQHTRRRGQVEQDEKKSKSGNKCPRE